MTRPRRIVIVGGLPYYVGGEITDGERLLVAAPPERAAIPLGELRARIAELDPTRPVVTLCKGGQRAYFASRILRQRGFAEVRTATGGMVA